MKTTENIQTPPYSRRIRRARSEAGLTLEDAALLWGVSPRIIRYWEAGDKRPGFRSLLGIASNTGHSVEWLMGIEHDPAEERLNAAMTAARERIAAKTNDNA